MGMLDPNNYDVPSDFPSPAPDAQLVRDFWEAKKVADRSQTALVTAVLALGRIGDGLGMSSDAMRHEAKQALVQMQAELTAGDES